VIRYAGGTTQSLGTLTASPIDAQSYGMSWTWTIPASAPAGAATATSTCTYAGATLPGTEIGFTVTP
jgi:hypothetical protein